MTRLGAALFLFLAACQEHHGPEVSLGSGAPGSPSVIQSALLDGSLGFVRRIDGDIREVFRAAVTEDRSQYVLLTGTAAGQDQCKVILLADDGEFVTEYRVSGITPFLQPPSLARGPGETRRQRQHPVRGHVIPFSRNGRRFLLIGTGGMFYPSSLILTEVAARDRLVERFVFWNAGSIHHLVVHGPYIVALGLNNKLRDDGRYTPAVAIFHMEDLRSSTDEPRRGIAPAQEPGGARGDGGYRFYLRMSTDRGWRYGWWSPEIADGVLHARTSSGLTYVVDLASGETRLVATTLYRNEYQARRREDATLPPIEQHLSELEREVLVWTGQS